MIHRILASTLFLFLFLLPQSGHAEFRAGAIVVDVTPETFPVIVNGGFLSRTVDKVHTKLSARTIALDDGKERVVIMVVDSCMLPRDLLDDVKQLASAETGLPVDRILISATHTHTAASACGALGTDPDPNYVPLIRQRLVEAIKNVQKDLVPARIGFGKIRADDYTALRRWIIRPDRVGNDPFGNPTVRATMHAGRDQNNAIGPTGPEDPDLSLISIQTATGKPLAVLANFSMHYFGDRDISADYFGLFSEGLKTRLADGNGPFVGIMSHGCSGDIWRRDYFLTDAEAPKPTIESYTNGLLDLAMEAYQKIDYRSDVDLEMKEARFQLNYRVPDAQRLEWAQKIMAEMGDRLPQNQTEVYAREQVLLHEKQSTEVVVQAIRVGDIAIATTPCETYALTGMKIKLQSPLEKTIVIELANGGDGYIPPPEQHLLGGYNTWPARSAGLEVEAEPKIVATALNLLQQISPQPRREYVQKQGDAVKAILKAKPFAYYRLDEFAGPRAKDSSGHQRDAIYESRVCYFLEGPDAFQTQGETNRAAHFVGERLRAGQVPAGKDYSVSLWIWNGMPVDGRDVTGWFLSRGTDHILSSTGEHLGLGGTSGNTGKLIYAAGTGDKVIGGKTEIPRWTWNHVVFVRQGDQVRVYLNGNKAPEIETTSPAGETTEELFLAGRCDDRDNWEGRLDEVAIFDRALTPDEVASLRP